MIGLTQYGISECWKSSGIRTGRSVILQAAESALNAGLAAADLQQQLLGLLFQLSVLSDRLKCL